MISEADSNMAVMSLRMRAAAPAVPEETVPEETIPEETVPEVFEPGIFWVNLNKTNLKVGQKVKVIVTTSADVDYLLVNGQKITKHTGEYLFRIWTVTITATSAGTMEIETVAYNRDDAASDPITVTVNVRKSGWFW